MPRKGTSTQRGYGAAHKKLRERVKPFVLAGQVDCWRCGRPIDPAEPWDLGHDDEDRSQYRGPEHMRCNRGAPNRRPVAAPSPFRCDTARAW